MFTQEKSHKLYLAVSAIVVLFGTIAAMMGDGQFYFERLRYFTILSNLFVSAGFLLILIPYKQDEFRYYILSSVLVNISLTALTYNLILVPIGGAQTIFSGYPNFSTHLLSALLVFGNYLIFEKKGQFTVKHFLTALIFPAVYFVVFLSIGHLIDFYPYFFMNPTMIGWPMVFVWFGIVAAVVILFGLLLLWCDKKMQGHFNYAKWRRNNR